MMSCAAGGCRRRYLGNLTLVRCRAMDPYAEQQLSGAATDKVKTASSEECDWLYAGGSCSSPDWTKLGSQ